MREEKVFKAPCQLSLFKCSREASRSFGCTGIWHVLVGQIGCEACAGGTNRVLN